MQFVHICCFFHLFSHFFSQSWPLYLHIACFWCVQWVLQRMRLLWSSEHLKTTAMTVSCQCLSPNAESFGPAAGLRLGTGWEHHGTAKPNCIELHLLQYSLMHVSYEVFTQCRAVRTHWLMIELHKIGTDSTFDLGCFPLDFVYLPCPRVGIINLVNHELCVMCYEIINQRIQMGRIRITKVQQAAVQVFEGMGIMIVVVVISGRSCSG